MKKIKGVCFIEFMIVICIVVIIVLFFTSHFDSKDEKIEFIKYCKTKGYTDEDCKWEWRRLKNGDKSRIMLIMPMKF
jgi:hypothetical protein